ncbi:MAG TPA: NAD(P)-dependent oxidoreductase [Armatimonadota bacterium]|jgi:3-hydroxyisobutyrate dehydrogenase-like beta-hydroxyacid dehydrogenase
MERVSFLGMGNMGRPMAANLLKACFDLTVYNRTPEKARELVERGAHAAATIAEAVQGAEAIITMLSDDAAVQAAILGEGGVASTATAGQYVIDMSTVSPDLSRELATTLGERGVHFLDAPVSGSVKPATEGTLTILVGGKAEDLETCRPLFESLGQAIFHLGPNGAGTQGKLCINSILGAYLQAIAEALVLAEHGGLTREAFLNVLNASAIKSPLSALKTPAFIAGDYPAAFALKHMAKDYGLALQQAREHNVYMPLAAAGNETYKAAVNLGHGDEDFAAVIKVLEGLSNQ